jgi:HPt (histidine-containing phosphotransfer) domain-containing protein
MPPALDPDVIASLRELTPPGEPDVLTEVLQLFLADVPGRIGRLRQAWHASNAAEVQRAAHSLKGSAGNIGAGDLLAVCRTIDDAAKAGELAQMVELVARLDAEYARVEAEIAELTKR